MNDDFTVALSKAMKYCSTKEVCIYDIKKKLSDWQVKEQYFEKIVDILLNEKFIDEQRYANAFANDKFRFNNWGKRKIEYELKKKNIPQLFVNQAVSLIDESDYLKKIKYLVAAKLKNTKAKNNFIKKQKILRFMVNKGFEPDIVSNCIDDFLPNNL